MDYTEKIQDAVAAVEEQQQPPSYTCENGVVLKFKPFSIFRVMAVLEKFKDPPIPKEWDEERQVWDENPWKKEYLDAKEEVASQRGMATIDAILAFGTEIVSIPDDVEKPEDTNWVEEMQVVGVELNLANATARRLNWLKMVAVGSTDLTGVLRAGSSVLPISQEGVGNAMAGFRSDEVGSANLADSTETQG